ncbi:Crp/Fnr family transcriptional regulator [Flavihumibacter sp. CACIAM 22H1]|uniref:Crp/Fnr family transcriptional regulator n=1 Tax=Flavihumibacter sp. CACIAM 22H1 TaxID=1812911 RepID=UPI0007A856DB|nr:Crp/Fnr family transcriptional regulator [Flavihumibacter sp. CACIAM 22H1]KYP16372.1 MAG: hypothetical protein A1D16_17085 [Flavihumibacter sp. CACIAM 22H1]
MDYQQNTELLAISQQTVYLKGEFFLREGQIPRKFGFVQSGLFRYYYQNDKGIEFTKAFIPATSILASYTAMLGQTGSQFFVQALETSTVLEVNYLSWLKLQEKDPAWDKFLIKALEKGYASKEKRERDLLLLDAETRYRNFRLEFPGLDKRVQLQHIASYLGIQPESLSRIRKKRSS